MKICKKCNKELSFECFHKNSHNKDGYHVVCKECRGGQKLTKEQRDAYNIKRKERYKEKDPIEIKERRRQYYLKNKEKIIEQVKQYTEANKEKVYNRQRMYRENNKDKIKELNTRYYVENSEKLKEQTKIRYFNNVDANREWMREYRKNNVEAVRNSKRKTYNKHKNKSRIRGINYYRRKMKNDPYYRLTRKIRSRVNSSFRVLSKNGKIMTCAEYGIDFKEIFKKVGPKPKGNYQLDHIIPLNEFNLDNPRHVKLAHSSVNLRWILAIDNLIKYTKIVDEVFENKDLLAIWDEIQKDKKVKIDEAS